MVEIKPWLCCADGRVPASSLGLGSSSICGQHEEDCERWGVLPSSQLYVAMQRGELLSVGTWGSTDCLLSSVWGLANCF